MEFLVGTAALGKKPKRCSSRSRTGWIIMVWFCILIKPAWVIARRKDRGLSFWAIDSKQAVAGRVRKALRDKIRQLTGRTRSGSLGCIIAELNPILRGWFGYFKHAHRSTFRDVDGFVRRRLRAILRKREKRPGFGRTSCDHRRWPNAFFAQHGLFTLHVAHTAASQPRKGNC